MFGKGKGVLALYSKKGSSMLMEFIEIWGAFLGIELVYLRHVLGILVLLSFKGSVGSGGLVKISLGANESFLGSD